MTVNLDSDDAYSIGSIWPNKKGATGAQRYAFDPPALRRLSRNFVSVILSLLNISLVTGVLIVLNQHLARSLIPIAYLIPIVFAATRWGFWPATLSSLAGIAAADFFFFAPLYSFRVDDPQEAVDLALFLVVSLVCSNLAARLRRETEALRQRETEMHALYDFSRRLASCFTIADLIVAVQQHLERAFGFPIILFAATPDGRFDPAGPRPAPPVVKETVAEMSSSGSASLRRTVADDRGEAWLLHPLSSNASIHGVIAMNVGVGSQQAIKRRVSRIEKVLGETDLTLQRLEIGKAMEEARLHLQAQMLRDAFHGTLSHELCSPLAAIQGSASVLESIPAIQRDSRSRDLVDAISEETAQLKGYIDNLLSATRVAAGGLSPRLEWADPKDVVNSAIERRARRLHAHRIERRFPDDLPLLHIDSGLVEEVYGQIVENAAKYSPSGSTITVEISFDAERVRVGVSDQGVGVTSDEQQKLGNRSFRGARHSASIPGSGLGFWIASTFIRAHGGSIAIQSRGPGLGTTVSICLPRTAEISTFKIDSQRE